MPLITAPPDLSHTLTPPAARHPDRKIKTPLPRLQNPQFFSLSPFSRQEYRAYQTPGLILLPKLTSTSTHQPTKRQETPPSSLHSTHIHTHSSTSTSTHPNQQETTPSSLHSPYPTNPPVFLFYIQTTLFFLVARKRNNNNSPTGGQQQLPSWGATTTTPQPGKATTSNKGLTRTTFTVVLGHTAINTYCLVWGAINTYYCCCLVGCTQPYEGGPPSTRTTEEESASASR